MILRIPPKPHHELVDYLAALPVPSYVQDKHGHVWMKTTDGWIGRDKNHIRLARDIAINAPLILVGAPS